tara:strand:- start:218 stop:1006 length:789 start_codon:yes stop_codon:yes gene_type:complete
MMRPALITVLLCSPVLAGPDQSLRPVARTGNGVTAPFVTMPTSGDTLIPQAAEVTPVAQQSIGIAASLRPVLRSEAIEKAAKKRRNLLAEGAVCDDVAIQGKLIGRVKPKLKGCGVEAAVQIQSVSGVRLSQASVMDCKTAKALKNWIEDAAKPAFAGMGGLRGLRVAAHYTCRTRNNKPGGKISEHGRGRAIDISAFQLKTGQEISVLKGWNAAASRKVMRRVHKGACGPFGTILGPKADRYHLDHFHLDTARYRSGPYCR